ncbi:MAG: hypothetical protein IJA34_16820 [Lachnospiraceae bacterium]|nr:hypothetical protein [Lachnospiraceae bacterium]
MGNDILSELETSMLFLDETYQKLKREIIRLTNENKELKESLMKVKKENETYEKNIREVRVSLVQSVLEAREEAEQWHKRFLEVTGGGYNTRGAGKKKNGDTEKEMLRVAKEIQEYLEEGYSDKEILEKGWIKKYNHNKHCDMPIKRATYFRCKKLLKEVEEENQ